LRALILNPGPRPEFESQIQVEDLNSGQGT
jgi:hypothetical protein